MIKVFLKKGRHHRIEDGHPWIYGNEIERISANTEQGTIVDVYDGKNHFMGRGYYNDKSHITVRLLTYNKQEEIDRDFFNRKIKSCYEYRQKIGYHENFRLVFGEADFLPALIIDKFSDYFVIQTLSYGMDRWKEIIADVLNEQFSPKGIYERNDAPVRKLEGLPEQKNFLSPPFTTKFTIRENEINYTVDVENGQKTGFFLDQKENREALQHIAKDAEVLDCFCYTGSFSISAAKFGAKNVLGIDISDAAIKQATENAALNEFGNRCQFQVGNAFDLLPIWAKEKRTFDIVVLDPPAFTKSRSGIESAIRGYKEINLRAMKLIRSGGFLLTFSCSYFMDPGLFFDTVARAASDAGKTIRQVAYLSQAKDHPIVWTIEETNYLKGFLLEIV